MPPHSSCCPSRLPLPAPLGDIAAPLGLHIHQLGAIIASLGFKLHYYCPMCVSYPAPPLLYSPLGVISAPLGISYFLIICRRCFLSAPPLFLSPLVVINASLGILNYNADFRIFPPPLPSSSFPPPPSVVAPVCFQIRINLNVLLIVCGLSF